VTILRPKSEFLNIDLSVLKWSDPKGDKEKEFKDPPLSDLFNLYDVILESLSTCLVYPKYSWRPSSGSQSLGPSTGFVIHFRRGGNGRRGMRVADVVWKWQKNVQVARR
jgi:hypothetical protein